MSTKDNAGKRPDINHTQVLAQAAIINYTSRQISDMLVTTAKYLETGKYEAFTRKTMLCEEMMKWIIRYGIAFDKLGELMRIDEGQSRVEEIAEWYEDIGDGLERVLMCGHVDTTVATGHYFMNPILFAKTIIPIRDLIRQAVERIIEIVEYGKGKSLCEVGK